MSNYKSNKKEIEIFELSTTTIIIHVQHELFSSVDINSLRPSPHREIIIKNETNKEITIDISKINVNIYEVNFIGFTIIGNVKSKFNCVFIRCKLTHISSPGHVEIGEDSEIESISASRIFLFDLKNIKNQIKISPADTLRVDRCNDLTLDITNVNTVEIESSNINSVINCSVSEFVFNGAYQTTIK